MTAITISKVLTLTVLVTICCQMAVAAPRVKRDDIGADEFSLSPVEAESQPQETNRDKRKVTETFAAKNAILGYVFGKIDGFLDAKTRFINVLDKQNVIKNQQHNIVAPVPIPDIQTLVQAVVSPKIMALTQTIGSLSGGLGGAFGGSSGAGGAAGDDGSAAGGASAGIGGLLSSFLRLSGPILSSSSQSAAGGASISGTATLGDSPAADDETPY